MKANPVLSVPKHGETQAQVWAEWYRQLRSNFGRQVSNQLFIKAWSVRGTSSANQPLLRDELRKGGLTLDTSAWDKLVDTGGGVADYFGDIFSLGKYTAFALVIILVAGVGLTVYNIARRPGETAGTVLKYAK